MVKSLLLPCQNVPFLIPVLEIHILSHIHLVTYIQTNIDHHRSGKAIVSVSGTFFSTSKCLPLRSLRCEDSSSLSELTVMDPDLMISTYQQWLVLYPNFPGSCLFCRWKLHFGRLKSHSIFDVWIPILQHLSYCFMLKAPWFFCFFMA